MRGIHAMPEHNANNSARASIADIVVEGERQTGLMLLGIFNNNLALLEHGDLLAIIRHNETNSHRTPRSVAYLHNCSSISTTSTKCSAVVTRQSSQSAYQQFNLEHASYCARSHMARAQRVWFDPILAVIPMPSKHIFNSLTRHIIKIRHTLIWFGLWRI